LQDLRDESTDRPSVSWFACNWIVKDLRSHIREGLVFFGQLRLSNANRMRERKWATTVCPASNYGGWLLSNFRLIACAGELDAQAS